MVLIKYELFVMPVFLAFLNNRIGIAVIIRIKNDHVSMCITGNNVFNKIII